MPYQQGYQQGQHAGYWGYGQAPQTHMYQANQAQYANQQQQQHPMVVISQQPRPDVSNFQTSPHPYQSQCQHQAGFNKQYHPPYDQYAQQHYYYPQSQQFHSQSVPQQPIQFQSQPNYQVPYQPPPHQAPYQQSTAPQFQDPYSSSRSGHGSQSSHQQTFSQPPYQQVSYPQAQGSPRLNDQRPPPTLPSGQVRHTSQQVRSESHSQSHTQAPRAQQRSHQQAYTPVASSTPQQQSVVAQVEIPVQRGNARPTELEMARSPKRRRSNEGHAVPVCDGPVLQDQAVLRQQKQAPVSSSPLTELTSSQFPSTPQPSVDYQAVLLGLADEYIAAAYSMNTSLATSDDAGKKREEYYALMSNAMACLESVLNNFRQPDPRKEARIRLRLASMLVEGTENDEEAEEVLSKGVSLCERSRLTDLKYAMHHLLVRVVMKSNIKAALRSLDKLVQEVETLRITHWMYAFRFMRVSLSLQMEGHQDTATVLKHITAISVAAEEQRYVAVKIIAAVFEAIVHIRSGLPDAVELSQRAMAAARTHQLGPEMEQMPQARALLDCLDLACCLIEFNPDQVATKMQQMHDNMDTGTRNSGWNKDGSMLIELASSTNEDLEQDTSGIMRSSTDGKAVLVMQWLTKSQLYMLGFILSGMANMYKNSSDNKAESFLSDGLKLANVAPDKIRQSLTASAKGVERQNSLSIAIQLHLVFAYCTRYDWTTARKAIRDIRSEYAQLGSELDKSTARALLYLEAVCRQGMGEFQGALEIYDSPNLTFELDTKASATEKDLRALASMNSIFILRTLGAAECAKADSLLNAVESHCLNNPNKTLLAAYHIVKATSQGSNNAIIKTKQYLQSAVQVGKASSNNQLLTIAMNVMTTTFFTNIVGDQAQKSAGAGRSLAKKTHDKLWMVVADGMYGEILERCGKSSEAEATRREARSLIPDLPPPLKDSLQVSNNT